MTSAIFYSFAVLALISAAYIIFTRNVLHAALSLIITLLCVAVIYVFSNAEFVAVTQIMIYVGGIVVLIVFGVMLTNDISNRRSNSNNINRFSGGLITVSIAALLIYGSLKLPNGAIQNDRLIPIELLGERLMTTYLLPFEIAAVLLLISLVAASIIAGNDLKVRRK